MIRWRSGRVSAVGREWPGVREVTVDVPSDGATPALAYVDLVGSPDIGDEVVLNTTALAQGLGTGGHALVVALPGRLPADQDGPGHIVKARYTPLQTSVLGVDEQQSDHHDLIAAATSLDGLPVVVSDLHSALPAVVAGLLAERPDARIAYVLTDGGALPLAYSRTVAALSEQLCGTVSTGQAFGGDLETVTVHTGLLAARHVLRADVAVVSQGPGNLGTGTPWGFSGVAAGEAVNAVGVLGGRAVGALRISGADARERHRGISHHCLTAFGRVALAPVDLVVPAPLPETVAVTVERQLAGLGGPGRVVRVPDTGLRDVLRRSPVSMSTMGRSLETDLIYFVAAAAAGRYAARLIGG
ncbi:MAG: DUF3866 family protein [bacterium]